MRMCFKGTQFNSLMTTPHRSNYNFHTRFSFKLELNLNTAQIINIDIAQKLYTKWV